MPSTSRRPVCGLALVAALGLGASACQITADDLFIDPDLLNSDIEGQVLRVGLSANLGTLADSYPGAPIIWKVEANGSVLGEGLGASGDLVDLDATAAFAGAATGSLAIQASGWLDLDGDRLQGALEPATTVTAAIAVTEGYSAEYDVSGRQLAIYGLTLAVSGTGGTGSFAAPATLEAHAWTDVSSYTYGTSYLLFTAPAAGRYVFVSRGDDAVYVQSLDTSISSEWQAHTSLGQVGAIALDADFAEGDQLLLEVRSQGTVNGFAPSVKTYRILAMRAPAAGDNAAHAVIDSTDWGLGDLEIYNFASATTAYEGANARWVDGANGDHIIFARPKAGDELNDPRLVWGDYRQGRSIIAFPEDYNYINGGGQVFNALADDSCLNSRSGDEHERTDSSPAGTHMAVDWVFTTCDVESGGFVFNVTAMFRR